MFSQSFITTYAMQGGTLLTRTPLEQLPKLNFADSCTTPLACLLIFNNSKSPLRNFAVWQPPPPSCIKINVKASFVASCGSTSVGIVARNSVGEVTLSSSDFIGVCSSV